MLVAFLGDQSTLKQPAMRAGKVGQCNLHVMPVIGWHFGFGLSEQDAIAIAQDGPAIGAPAVLGHTGDAAQYLAIEAADGPKRRGFGNVTFYIGHTERE